jgi:hypothetical protein
MLASGKFPLARSANGRETWVPGGDDLFLLKDGQLVAQQRPEFSRNALIALANDSQYVYGLHITTIGNRSMSEVVRLNTQGEPRFYPSEEYWGSLTADEQGVYILAANTQELVLVTLDKEGKEVNRATAMLPIPVYDVQLHALGGRVYATGTNGMMSIVGYFEGGVWTEVLQDPLPIVGPQTSPDGTMWIAIGGALARLNAGAVEPVGDSRFITCLERWNDLHYVCVGSDLHQLTQDGIGDQVFQMQGIRGTDPKLIPPDAQDHCAQQWTLYTIDATRSGLMFVDWSSAGELTGDSAAAGSGAGGAVAGAPSAGTGAAGSHATAGAGPAAVADQAPAAKSSAGCSVAAAESGAAKHACALLFAAIGAAFSIRRARKRTRR